MNSSEKAMSELKLDGGEKTSKLPSPSHLRPALTAMLKQSRDLESGSVYERVTFTRLRLRSAMFLILLIYSLGVLFIEELRVLRAVHLHNADPQSALFIYAAFLVIALAAIAVATKRASLLLPFIALQMVVSIALVLCGVVFVGVAVDHLNEVTRSGEFLGCVLAVAAFAIFHTWTVFVSIAAYKSFSAHKERGGGEDADSSCDEDELYFHGSPFDGHRPKVVHFADETRRPQTRGDA